MYHKEYNMLKSMDIWAFESPIGTPLKQTRLIDPFGIRQNKDIVEDVLMDQNNVCNIRNIPDNIFSSMNSTMCTSDYTYTSPSIIKRSLSPFEEISGSSSYYDTSLNNSTTYQNPTYNYELGSMVNTKDIYPRHSFNSQCDQQNYGYKTFVMQSKWAIIPKSLQTPPNSLFFVIKSFSLEHIKRAYKHNIWSSTHLGNKKLAMAYRNLKIGAKIYLFFSVNASGRFCGVAEMTSNLSRDLDTSIWDNNSKYGTAFQIEWVIVRDVENRFFRHLTVPDNLNKPVTNSRDTQLIPPKTGSEMLDIFISSKSNNASFLDPNSESDSII